MALLPLYVAIVEPTRAYYTLTNPGVQLGALGGIVAIVGSALFYDNLIYLGVQVGVPGGVVTMVCCHCRVLVSHHGLQYLADQLCVEEPLVTCLPWGLR